MAKLSENMQRGQRQHPHIVLGNTFQEKSEKTRCEEDVGTLTSSSVTLLGQIFVKTCSEDSVSIPTSSSATPSRKKSEKTRGEEDVSTSTSSSTILPGNYL